MFLLRILSLALNQVFDNMQKNIEVSPKFQIFNNRRTKKKIERLRSVMIYFLNSQYGIAGMHGAIANGFIVGPTLSALDYATYQATGETFTKTVRAGIRSTVLESDTVSKIALWIAKMSGSGRFETCNAVAGF